MMRLHASCGSDRGKIRRKNEDNLLFFGKVLPAENSGMPAQSGSAAVDSPCLLGVFDGMGGHANGERASWIAAETARKLEKELQEDNLQTQLEEICLKANDNVCDEANGSGMGTTAAMVCFYRDKYYMCNIGDTPIFLLRNGELRQISVDHNQRDSFERITGKTAKPGQKFKLTQCIGIPKDELLIEPYTACGDLCEGDLFLLCSDGVTDMLNAGTIVNILSNDMAPQGMVMRLIEMALAAGGRDNITVICVKVVADEDRTIKKKRFFSFLRK